MPALLLSSRWGRRLKRSGCLLITRWVKFSSMTWTPGLASSPTQDVTSQRSSFRSSAPVVMTTTKIQRPWSSLLSNTADELCFWMLWKKIDRARDSGRDHRALKCFCPENSVVYCLSLIHQCQCRVSLCVACHTYCCRSPTVNMQWISIACTLFHCYFYWF